MSTVHSGIFPIYYSHLLVYFMLAQVIQNLRVRRILDTYPCFQNCDGDVSYIVQIEHFQPTKTFLKTAKLLFCVK